MPRSVPRCGQTAGRSVLLLPACRLALVRRMTVPVALSVAVSLALLLAGCGDDEVALDSGAPQDPSTTTGADGGGDLPEEDGDDRGGDDGGEGGAGNDGDGGSGDDGSDDDDGDGDGSVSCDDDDRPTIEGTSLTVAVTGDCDEVTVDGTSLDVTIESTEVLSVAGARNEVEISGSIDEIVVNGAQHEIRYPGDPSIEDSSALSDLEPTDGG